MDDIQNFLNGKLHVVRPKIRKKNKRNKTETATTDAYKQWLRKLLLWEPWRQMSTTTQIYWYQVKAKYCMQCSAYWFFNWIKKILKKKEIEKKKTNKKSQNNKV